MKATFFYSAIFLLTISTFHLHTMELDLPTSTRKNRPQQSLLSTPHYQSSLLYQQDSHLSSSNPHMQQLANVVSSNDACVIIDLTKVIMQDDTKIKELSNQHNYRNQNRFEEINSDASYMASLCALPCVVMILLGGSVMSFLCIIASKTNISGF